MSICIHSVFFELLRSGLWEKSVCLLPFGEVDFAELFQMAEGQSVVGLIAAGLESVEDRKFAKKDMVQFIGRAVQLEQRNMEMNGFIKRIVGMMYDSGIRPVLVKGQGVAQCYERPQWRTCGDVDFFFDATNYQLAKSFLTTFAASVGHEDVRRMHFGMTIAPWVVELHGLMNPNISKRANKGIEMVQRDIFENGGVRSWNNDGVDITLPSADNDVIIIFTHFVGHFFKGGIGLRQVCDWCRLLWTYRLNLDLNLLEKRVSEMGLMSEWKAFAALAVDWLGMPSDSMPFYSPISRWKRGASRIMDHIMKTGNFGQKRDKSRYQKHSYVVNKVISFFSNTSDSIYHFFIFPKDATRVWLLRLKEGLMAVSRGK